MVPQQTASMAQASQIDDDRVSPPAREFTHFEENPDL